VDTDQRTVKIQTTCSIIRGDPDHCASTAALETPPDAQVSLWFDMSEIGAAYEGFHEAPIFRGVVDVIVFFFFFLVERVPWAPAGTPTAHTVIRLLASVAGQSGWPRADCLLLLEYRDEMLLRTECGASGPMGCALRRSPHLRPRYRTLPQLSPLAHLPLLPTSYPLKHRLTSSSPLLGPAVRPCLPMCRGRLSS
jgi:hypothetical protein